jgi:hypothetical protein
MSFRWPALLALLLPVGCGYTDEQACADLASAVWPWAEVSPTAIETVPLQGSSQALPVEAVDVAATVRRPDLFPEPVPATFRCVRSGQALVDFGWVAPPALARRGGLGPSVSLP